jgi:CheY-like chemotaxis protein
VDVEKQRKNILIIDDEPAWLKIITFFLKDRGYEVVSAESGAEALKTLVRYRPDLIMSDIRMPDMNGFDLLDHIRKLPSVARTPVVFFSSIDDYDARKVARDLGATDYIVKPFSQDDVNSVLAKYLP